MYERNFQGIPLKVTFNPNKNFLQIKTQMKHSNLDTYRQTLNTLTHNTHSYTHTHKKNKHEYKQCSIKFFIPRH